MFNSIKLLKGAQGTLKKGVNESNLSTKKLFKREYHRLYKKTIKQLRLI